MTKLKEYIYPKNYSSKNKAVEFFNEFGFLSLKGIIPQEQIDVLIRDLIFKKRFSENSYTNLTPKDILKIQDSYTEQHCYLEVGDVIIFHKDLIHKSNNNLSELTRPVGVHRLTSSSEGDWVRRSPNEL